MDKMMQEEQLFRWYEIIKNFKKKEANQYKIFFESFPNLISEDKVIKLYHLFRARYFLMYDQYELAARELAHSPEENESDYQLKYFYYFFQGILSYKIGRYAEGVKHLKVAEPIVKTIGNRKELAEFQYYLACAYHRTYHFILANDCVKEALKIWQENQNHLRTTHCEIVIAMNHIQMKQFKEAEIYLRRSLRHSARVKDEQVKMLVLHNFGYFYTMVEQPKVALTFLNQALELIHSDMNEYKVQNLFLSAECFYKTEQTEKARRTLLRAEALAQQTEFKDYIHLCKMTKAKYFAHSDLKQVYEKGIAHFLGNQRWHLVTKYSEELAVLYQHEQSFEKSCRYYALVIESQKSIKEARMLSI